MSRLLLWGWLPIAEPSARKVGHARGHPSLSYDGAGSAWMTRPRSTLPRLGAIRSSSSDRCPRPPANVTHVASAASSRSGGRLAPSAAPASPNGRGIPCEVFHAPVKLGKKIRYAARKSIPRMWFLEGEQTGLPEVRDVHPASNTWLIQIPGAHPKMTCWYASSKPPHWPEQPGRTLRSTSPAEGALSGGFPAFDVGSPACLQLAACTLSHPSRTWRACAHKCLPGG